MLKSGIFLTFFNALSSLLGLARNIIIARMVSVEDFGIASTFALAVAIIEMSANIGVNRLIVQSQEGDAEEFQATLHGFQFVRGLMSAAIILLVAHPLAHLFHTPNVAWAYQTLAVVPLLRGFMHLDMNRYQRDRRFLPGILLETLAQAIATALAFAFGYWLKDYRAMLFAILGQNITYALISQLLAERKYKLGWNGPLIRNAFDFGWPLMINSFLMFAIFHGDRMIIGNKLGLTILGWYSVANTLTLMTASVIGNVVDTISLPVLSRSQTDEARFQKLAKTVLEGACLVGAAVAAGYALLGGPVLQLLFGEKMADARIVLVVLAIMYAVRTARTGPSIIAISRRDTTSPLLANIARVLFIPIAWAAVQFGHDVVTVVAIALAGEIAAFLVALWKLREKLDYSTSHMTTTFCQLLAFLCIIGLYEYTEPANAFAARTWFGPLIVLGLLSFAFLLQNLRSFGFVQINRIRSGHA